MALAKIVCEQCFASGVATVSETEAKREKCRRVCPVCNEQRDFKVVWSRYAGFQRGFWEPYAVVKVIEHITNPIKDAHKGQVIYCQFCFSTFWLQNNLGVCPNCGRWAEWKVTTGFTVSDKAELLRELNSRHLAIIGRVSEHGGFKDFVLAIGKHELEQLRAFDA